MLWCLAYECWVIFKQLDRDMQRIVVPSSAIRLRLAAAAELPIDYKKDVICLAYAIKKSRNLCKNPASIHTMVWKIPVSTHPISLTLNYSNVLQGIIYTVDTILEKTLSDAMEEVLGLEGDDSGGDLEAPNLLDDELLVEQLRKAVIANGFD